MLCVGCGGGTRDVRVALVSTKNLNPDDSGAALAVIVRVYQLRGKEKFERASFKGLWKNDTQVLEGDVLDRKEVTLHPDSEMSVELEVDTKKGAEFLGVMALFRKPDGETWRRVTSANVSSWVPFKTPVVRVVLDESSIKFNND